MRTSVLVVCLLALASCSSAAVPGAQDAIDQTDRAFRVQAESDLRNAANAEEAYFAQTGIYTTDMAALGVNSSGDVTLSAPQADAAGFCVQAVHVGSGTTWHFQKAEAAVADGPC